MNKEYVNYELACSSNITNEEFVLNLLMVSCWIWVKLLDFFASESFVKSMTKQI